MIVDALLDAEGHSGTLLGRSAPSEPSAVTSLQQPFATMQSGERKFSTRRLSLRFFYPRNGSESNVRVVRIPVT